jgi:hypothetical protein
VSIFKKAVFVVLAFFSFTGQANATFISGSISLPGASGGIYATVQNEGVIEDLGFEVSKGVPTTSLANYDIYGGVPYYGYTAVVNNTPFVFAAALETGGGVYSIAEGWEYYYAEVVGAPNTNVPVYIKGAVSTSADKDYGSNNDTTASVQVNEGVSNFFTPPGKQLFVADVCSGNQCQNHYPDETKEFNTRVLIPSNTIFTVLLAAEAQAQNNSISKSQNASAYADPHFYIDPTFTNASQYTLAFSSGIGNSPLSATPLPASLPMFGAAIIGLGILGYRRKKLSATA